MNITMANGLIQRWECVVDATGQERLEASWVSAAELIAQTAPSASHAA